MSWATAAAQSAAKPGQNYDLQAHVSDVARAASDRTEGSLPPAKVWGQVQLGRATAISGPLRGFANDPATVPFSFAPPTAAKIDALNARLRIEVAIRRGRISIAQIKQDQSDSHINEHVHAHTRTLAHRSCLHQRQKATSAA